MGIVVGQHIDGKYRVTACIGEGGMGAVYAGEYLKLHRRVAIKVLHASMATDPEVVTRFEREAQAAGRIGNDHILEVLDIGELPGGDRYMVMEFLDGEPMNERLTRAGRMPPRDIYPLARQILEGLAAAHAVGIIHRDLKPANIFILREKAGARDYVKIIDFGISKFQLAAGEAQYNQTQTGTIIGTARYMSPEQARGLRQADARSDLYSVGVIVYEAVTGRCPFEGASTNDVLFKLFTDEAPPMESLLESPDHAFNSIVMRALAKDPNNRFAKAEDFLTALDRWAETGEGVPPRSSAPVIASSTLPHTLRDRPSAAQPPTAPVYPPARMVDPGGAPSPRTLPSTERSWAAAAAVVPTSPPVKKSFPLLARLIGVTAVVGIGAAVVAVRVAARHDGAAIAAPSAGAPHAEPPPVPTLREALSEPLGPHPYVDASETPPAPSVSASAAAQAEPALSKGGPSRAPQPGPLRTQPNAKASKPNCESPYYVDSHGARVFKEQCL